MYRITRSIYKVVIFTLLVLFITGTAFSQSRRERQMQPERVMDAVGVKPGMIIGEAGAGAGFFTFFLAERVGDEGKVYANDINRRSLDRLKSQADRQGLDNIEIVVGDVDDPKFPAKDLDMIVMVYVLHHLDRPVDFMEKLEKYIKQDAPVVIIEQNTGRDRVNKNQDNLSGRQILALMERTNFKLDRRETFLDRDTVYIYKLDK
ncbi:class I SAM-dependent methyltransferase [candidate division KSB1 bacterium]